MKTKKNSWRTDFMVIGQLVAAGLAFGILGRLLNANHDFIRGFYTGFGASAVVAVLVMVIGHLIKGESLFYRRSNDERVKMLMQKAASITYYIVFFGMAGLSFLAFSEVNLDLQILAPAILGGMALCNLGIFTVLSRLQ